MGGSSDLTAVDYATQRPEEALLALYNNFTSSNVAFADVTFQPLSLRNGNDETVTCNANFADGPNIGNVRLNWTRLDIAQFSPSTPVEVAQIDYDAASDNLAKFDFLAAAISTSLGIVMQAEDIDQVNTALQDSVGAPITVVMAPKNVLFYGSIEVTFVDGGGGFELWNLNGFNEDGTVGDPGV